MNTDEIGNNGEALAIEHLRKKGYKIRHTNWRYGHKEVDIVAQTDIFIVFIEVKTRSSKSAAVNSPYNAVNKTKQRNIIQAANGYIFKYNIHLDARFDIITVINTGKGQQIEHIEGAFGPSFR